MARVEIPRNAKDLLELARRVFKKHQDDGDNSVLRPLEWKTVGPTIVEAIELHNKAEELRKQMEIAYEKRDGLLKDINDLVKNSRDVLTGVYKKEMKKLGDWGYNVIDSPRNNGNGKIEE